MKFKKGVLLTSFLLATTGMVAGAVSIPICLQTNSYQKQNFEKNSILALNQHDVSLWFDPTNIYDQIQLGIINGVKQDGVLIPNKDGAPSLEQLKNDLATLVAQIIVDNQDNVANSWLPNNGKNDPVITPSDLVIDETKILLSKNDKGQDVVTFDKGAINIKHNDGHLFQMPPLGSMVSTKVPPRPEPSEPSAPSAPSAPKDNTWVIWVIVGTIVGIALIFIILLICYIVKRRKASRSIG